MESMLETTETSKSPVAPLSDGSLVKSETPSVSVKEQVCGFVRIKRRADEDPATKLLVTFKRQKMVGGTEIEHVESVLKFAGSIEGDHKLDYFFKNFEGNGLQESSKRSKLNPRNIRKLKALFSPAAAKEIKREDVQKESIIRRCRIVSAHRGIDPDEFLKTAAPSSYSMFDLVDDEVTSAGKGDDVITVNGVPMVPVQDEASPSKKQEGLKTYVYDFYALPDPIEPHEDFVNVERQWDLDQFMYDDEPSEDEKEVLEDDEDSNDENNPNYDYPEEVSDEKSGSDVDYAAGYYDEDDDSDNAAAWVNGSKGMKDLASHMHTMNLGSQTRTKPGYCDEDFFDKDVDDEF